MSLTVANVLQQSNREAEIDNEIGVDIRQHANQSRVCERCSEVPWRKLNTAMPSGTYSLLVIDQTVQDLIASSCTICQFLGDVISSRELLSGLSHPPYTLQHGGTVSVGNKHFSKLRLLPKNGGLHQGPHLLVTEEDLGPPVDSLMLGHTPIELIQGSISTCNCKHTHLCVPEKLDMLQNLRVLDVERRVVVPAPPDCQYVALSYVWGRPQGGVDFDHQGSLPIENLPATVSDGCFVAKKLGYKYIWVDRYCIDQGKHDDRNVQVAQMADIYAAAQLTIIAASGNDANHGLPGVRSRSSLHDSQASIGSVLLMSYPIRFPYFSLQDSKWASRAWTFQECYFGRRRLIFLDGHVTYHCSLEHNSVRIHGWFPYDDGDGLFGDDMSRMMNTLSAYTGRQLTYESDALAAIVSALTSFSHGSLRHIWGIPIRFSGTDCSHDDWGSDTELALFWRHEAHCMRRSAFPSWSPIAWNGTVSWWGKCVASSHGVRCVSLSKSMELDGTRSTTDDDPDNPPRYLEITTKMTSLKLITNLPPVSSANASQHQSDRSKQNLNPHLTLRLNDDTEMILHKPFWDTDPTHLCENDDIHGILFNAALQEGTSAYSIIMLVKAHGRHHERIGIIKLENILQNCFRLVVHESRYLRFREIGTNELWSHDLGDLEDMNNMDTKDIPFRLWDESAWETYFVTDTIILG